MFPLVWFVQLISPLTNVGGEVILILTCVVCIINLIFLLVWLENQSHLTSPFVWDVAQRH